MGYRTYDCRASKKCGGCEWLAVPCNNGYSLRALQPVDMFPHTKHVECIALFDRR